MGGFGKWSQANRGIVFQLNSFDENTSRTSTWLSRFWGNLGSARNAAAPQNVKTHDNFHMLVCDELSKSTT